MPPVARLHVVDGDGSIVNPTAITRFFGQALGAEAKTLPQLSDTPDVVIPSVPVLRKRGFDYRVVGVFGGQSSGKSTLLNHLFDTSFDVMDADAGRLQTTKGCFLSKAECSEAKASASGQGLFIMDFEGTDGVERGSNQNFEKQLTLFALSVADTLIINMWTTEVGRFNAANLSLLQTVFEVNLQLTAHDADANGTSSDVNNGLRTISEGGGTRGTSADKPTLLFVLRDHVEGQLEKLAGVVVKSLETLWAEITKPPMFAKSALTDFFRVTFASLPHFVLQKPQFQEAITDLRGWFVDASHPQYLYAHMKPGNFRSIPLDGVSQYLASCWEAIKANKDLDIPSQREMLARLRCAELAERIIDEHTTLVEQRLAGIKEGRIIVKASAWLRDVEDGHLKEFGAETEQYADAVVQEHYAELAAQLAKASDRLVLAQSELVAKALVRSCDGGVQQVMDSALTSVLPRIAAEFFEKVRVTRDHTAKKLRGEETQNVTQVKARLAEEQAKVHAAHSVRKFWKFVSADTEGIVDDIRKKIDKCSAEGGDAATKPGSEISSDAGNLDELLECLAGDTSVTSRTLSQLNKGMQARVRTRLESITVDPSTAMLNTFEKVLRTNEDGTTRFLSTVTGLDKMYGPARAAALMLLACVAVNRLDIGVSSNGTAQEDELTEAEARYQYIEQLVSKWQQEHALVEFGASDDSKVLIGRPSLGALPPQPKEAASDDGAARQAARHAFSTDLVMLDATAIERAYDMFEMKCDFAYKSERQRIESGQQSIPAWVFALLVLLGANEIWYLVTNPLLLIMLGLAVWFFFSNWVVAQWQKFEETGPPGVVLPAKAAIAMVEAQYRTHVAPLVQGGAAPPPKPASKEAEKKTQ